MPQELSPNGLLALLDALHRLGSPEAQGCHLLALPGVVRSLVGLLEEGHTSNLLRWPKIAGGGKQGVRNMVRPTAFARPMSSLVSPGAELLIGIMPTGCVDGSSSSHAIPGGLCRPPVASYPSQSPQHCHTSGGSH